MGKQAGRCTVAQVASKMKEKVINFCKTYKLLENQEKHLVQQYTQHKTKNAIRPISARAS